MSIGMTAGWLLFVTLLTTFAPANDADAQTEAPLPSNALRSRAQAYAGAIIEVAELRDLVDQIERLSIYLKWSSRFDSDFEQGLDQARQTEKAISKILDTDCDAPAVFEPSQEKRLQMAIEQLPVAVARTRADRDRGASLLPVSPEAETVPDKRTKGIAPTRSLAAHFQVFPVIISGKLDFYNGDGDWDLLRAFGFDAVCPWVGAWGYRGHVPSGSVNEVIADRVSRIEALVARNALEGFKTSIWIEPDDVITALERQHGPEVYLHAADGTYYSRSRIHNNANFWHPAVVEALESFLRGIGERFVANPNVLCYELFEEPDLVFAPANPPEGQALPRHAGGYSKHAKEAFQNSLRAQYGTIAALNTRYQTDYGDFDEVVLPGTAQLPNPSVPARSDFNRFRCESHAAFFAKLVDILKTADPNHPVVPQFLPMSFLGPRHGLDPFLLAQANWDFYSTHDWPGQGPAFETAFTYSVAHWADKPLWNEEYIWSNWVSRDAGEEALWGAARSGIWRQFAWGKRALELFVWDGLWDTDIEGDWNNEILNRASGMVFPRFAAGVFGHLPGKLDRLAPMVYPTEIVNDGLGVLVPTATLLGDDNPASTQWWGNVIARTLLADHWLPLFLPEAGIVDGSVPLEAFHVIVVPPARVLPRRLAAQLLDWVAAGGTLVWQGALGTIDEDGEPLGAFDQRADKGKVILWAQAREAEHGEGRLVRYEKDVFNSDRGLLSRVVAREYPARAVYSPSQDHELVLRKAPDGNLLLFVTSLELKKPGLTSVSVRGHWPRILDLSIGSAVTVPGTFDGVFTTFPVRTGPGEGVLFALYQS